MTDARLFPIRHATGRCSLGTVVVAGSDAGICAIELGDTPQEAHEHLMRRFEGHTIEPAEAEDAVTEWLAAVIAAVDGDRAFLDAPLDFHGTPFQRKVWERLCAIPVGTTLTYQSLARELGDPDALRAVAGACGANPLAVIIPCHRVLRTDGGLGGYRWGLARKRALLMREAALGELPLFG